MPKGLLNAREKLLSDSLLGDKEGAAVDELSTALVEQAAWNSKALWRGKGRP
jgi:hypothetical protein